ncbi:MAG: hypothetical protein K2Y35_02610 [Burkholderiales bacterium]|nr:hypothetical protein [Burkholderiales bacterium]
MGKSLIRVVATVAALLMCSASAYAAGLGKLTVISTLGQPFRGEIDLVSVKKDELSSLSVRMASPDAFKQADLPYTAYVSNLKLAIEKRPNGDPYVKVSSYQPLNEPFIDFLVELGWTSGRLVRAYTALVDPPIVTDAEASKAPEVKPLPPTQPPVTKAEAAPAQPAPPPAPPAPPAEVQPPVAEAAPAPEPEPAPQAAEPANPEPAVAQRDEGIKVPEPAVQTGAAKAPLSGQRAASTGGEVTTKRGDTLSKIAKANMTEGLALEQMLVLLYRENPDAFAGKNMNRLKTGSVLRLPDESSVVDMSPQDARKEVRVQAANWNAYREKLAAVAAETPAVDTGAQQSAEGKVTTTVQEKAPAAEAPKEVLKLSKGEPAKAGAGSQDAKALQDRIHQLEEEVASKSKAVKDSGERIAALEKTIKDMQALMEIKSKGVTDLQKPAAHAPAPAPAPKPEPKHETPPAAVAPPPKPTEPAVTPPPPAAAQTPETAPPKPPAGEEAAKPKKKFVPPPPPPPPSLVDQLLENPLYLAGGAAVLALLGFGGYTVLKRRGSGGEAAPKKDKKGGKKNSPTPIEDDVTTEIPSGAGLAAGRAGGDIHEEGDPLAEAEIFLTYGRDNLAEERLKEAIAATPKRYELHGKLLEIYAKRRDAAAFEQIAKELQSGTGSKGELWNKAVKLGYQIDPENTRYAAGRHMEDDGTATVVVGSGSALAAAAAAAATAMGTSRPGGSADAAKTNLDFNLGFDDSAIGTTTDIDLGRLGPEVEAATTTSTDIDLGALGESSDLTDSMVLDPGAKLPGVDNESTVQITALDGTAPLPTQSETAPVGGGLDFDFDVSAAAPATPGAPAAEADDGGLNFDISGLNLDLPTAAGGPPGSAAAPDLDLSGISLDLGSAETAAPAAAGGKDDKWYDVQTKFDLAKAYQEMGDREGAREILQEVLAEGDAEQKAAAQAVLGSLG